MSEYSEKLKDPRWQKKRLKILERDNFTCQKCRSTEKTLHIHHKTYNEGSEPWEYHNMVLITLCNECHEDEKENMKRACNDLIETLKISGFFYRDILELVTGFYHLRKIQPCCNSAAEIIKFILSNKKYFKLGEKGLRNAKK